MTRGHGWRFLDVGRRLERAMNATSLVRRALSAGPSDNAVLEPLLEIADSSMTYRRRYFARPQLRRSWTCCSWTTPIPAPWRFSWPPCRSTFDICPATRKPRRRRARNA